MLVALRVRDQHEDGPPESDRGRDECRPGRLALAGQLARPGRPRLRGLHYHPRVDRHSRPLRGRVRSQWDSGSCLEVALWPRDLERSPLTSSSSGFRVYKRGCRGAPFGHPWESVTSHCPRCTQPSPPLSKRALGAGRRAGLGCPWPFLPSWELWSLLDHRPQRGRTRTRAETSHSPAGRFPVASVKRRWPQCCPRGRLGGARVGTIYSVS